MIRGMTGYGSATVKKNNIKGVIEIKSLNHRYFDINFYMPIGFAAAENKIKNIITRHVQRGRVTLSFKITEKPTPKIVFHRESVNKYLHYAKILKKETALQNNLTLADLIKMPGVVEAQDVFISPQQIGWALDKGINQGAY